MIAIVENQKKFKCQTQIQEKEEEKANVDYLMEQDKLYIENEKLKQLSMFERRVQNAAFLKKQSEDKTLDKGRMNLQELLYNREKLKNFINEKKKGKFEDFFAKTSIPKAAGFF